MKKKKKKIKLSPARETFLAQSEFDREMREKERSVLERWFDKHNHKMEFLRTFFALATIILQLLILGKIFNMI